MIHTDTVTTPTGITRQTWQSFYGPALLNPVTGRFEGAVVRTCYRYAKEGAPVGAVDWTPKQGRKGDVRVRAYNGQIMARLYNVDFVYVLMILGGGITVRQSSWADVHYDASTGNLCVLNRRDGGRYMALRGTPRKDVFRILRGATKAKAGYPSVGATLYTYKKAARVAMNR